MKTNTLTSKLSIKTALLSLVMLFSLTGTNLRAQVLLDQHSLGNGASTWNITTTHPNEIIILSVGGYSWGYVQMRCLPTDVTVNGNPTTYLTKGEWLNTNFQWTCSIWAYVAPTPGVYTCAATEVGYASPFYFNYATSVYQNNCPLTLGNIIVGGVDSNQTLTTISASITTTLAGSFIYGTANNNDNGGTGTVVWNTINLLDWNYINNGIDGSQAGATLPAGTYNIVTTDNGASNVWMTEALIAVQPNQTCCKLTSSDSVMQNVSCFGGSNGSATATISVGVAPYTFVWSPGGQTTQAITGLSAGSYTVVVTDSGACSQTSTLTITQPAAALAATIVPTDITCKIPAGTAAATATGGTTPYTYSWSPGGQTNATATGLSAGNYTLTVTDANGCVATATTAITQPAPLAVSVTGPAMLCVGGNGNFTATVTGGTVPYTYAWSGGVTTNPASLPYSTTQTYSVVVTDNSGCTGTSSITIVSGPPLNLSLSGNTSMCGGMSTTLCATASGGSGGTTFLWEPGNFTTPCISVSPNSTTTYTITVQDNCGTNITESKTLNVNPIPSVKFSADVAQGCAPFCVQFRDNTTISGGAGQHIWSFGNGDTLQSTSPIYCYQKSGTYNVTLTVTSDSGCSSTLTDLSMVTVYSHPNASFTSNPPSVTILDPTIQFTDKSTDAYGLVYWTWLYGDGTMSNNNVAISSHKYADTGNYCPRLSVMNMHGCTDTATDCLVINPDYNLYIPSAFSPNSSGTNDIFIPKGQYIKDFEMYIFDRWGMKLYYTNDISKGWDGTMKEVMAQEDTYVYKIKVKDSKNIEHSYIGCVTLIK